jgi:hypothetical protein
MMTYIRLSLGLGILAVAGCITGPGTIFQFSAASQEESIIYVYRTPALWGAGMYPNIEVDGKPAGALPNGAYLLIRTTPGKHVITAKGNLASMTAGKETPLPIETEAGDEVFVRFRFEKEGEFRILGTMASSVVTPRHVQALHLVDAKTALEEISSLKLNSK